MRAVYWTSKMSSKCLTSMSVTTVPSSVGRNLPWSFVDVLAILNRGENRRVSGRTADALLFEHLHQRRFGDSAAAAR